MTGQIRYWLNDAFFRRFATLFTTFCAPLRLVVTTPHEHSTNRLSTWWNNPNAFSCFQVQALSPLLRHSCKCVSCKPSWWGNLFRNRLLLELSWLRQDSPVSWTFTPTTRLLLTTATCNLSTVPSAVRMLFLRCSAQYRAQLFLFLCLANAVWLFSSAAVYSACQCYTMDSISVTPYSAVPNGRNHSSCGQLNCCCLHSISYTIAVLASYFEYILQRPPVHWFSCLVRFLLLFACAISA